MKKKKSVEVPTWTHVQVTMNFDMPCGWCKAKPKELYFKRQDKRMYYACFDCASQNAGVAHAG